jgi:predicted acyltransferase
MNRERLVSVDAFRGATVAGMILVNNPGDWGNIYDPLEHAKWHGWTPTDLIFPFFLFVVGAPSPSLRATPRGPRPSAP